MRRVAILVVAIIAASLLLAVTLAGCEGEVSFTTASLSEVTMCQGVDENWQPVDATDVFAVDTPEIFCSAKLSHAPDGTEVSAEWIYIEGEMEDLSNYLIDTWSATAGSGYLYASLTRPDNGWPKGDYQVVFYIDGKEELSVPFSVR